MSKDETIEMFKCLARIEIMLKCDLERKYGVEVTKKFTKELVDYVENAFKDVSNEKNREQTSD